MWPVVFVAYLALHFGLYAAALRRTDAFNREWVVFGYHLGSTCLVALVACLLAIDGILDFAAVVLTLAVHGIYSLTFLELWALADGGYSLAILRAIHSNEWVEASLSDLGSSKRDVRARSLLKLHLCHESAGRLELTAFGRAVADLLMFVGRTANIVEAH